MRRVLFAVLAVSLLAAAATPALAQRGWSYPERDPFGGWGDRRDRDRLQPRRADEREGKVEVTRFVGDGDAAARLGQGPVDVTAAPAGTADERERATYEAAVIDQLAGAGYDTAAPADDSGQVVELRILHTVAAPAEAPRKPVSGEMAVGVSNRGSSVGMAIDIDLRKPRGALLSTRLEARIRDRASGAVLWEGRADIATRDGDERWSDQAIAARLAAALFSGFPGKSGETIEAG